VTIFIIRNILKLSAVFVPNPPALHPQYLWLYFFYVKSTKTLLLSSGRRNTFWY